MESLDASATVVLPGKDLPAELLAEKAFPCPEVIAEGAALPHVSVLIETDMALLDGSDNTNTESSEKVVEEFSVSTTMYQH